MEKEKSLVSRSGLLLIVFVVFVLFCGCSEPIPELKILQVTESNDGMLKVKYKLRTVDGSKCSLRVSFLAQGRNWTSAKEGSGSDGTEDLTSSNDWAEHTYIWEYKTDLGPGKHNNVKLRLVPYTLRKGYGDSAGPMTIGEPLVAVSLATNDSVSFVDPVANSVIFSVTVGDEPSALAQTSDGLTLLVANKAENTVSVVSVSGTLSGSITGTIPVGNSPVALALKNDGSLAFVANSADNTVGVINIPALSSTTTIPVGSNPVALALSPDQNILFVANKDDDTVSIVNLPTLSVVASIPVGDEPSSLVVTPDNKYLLVACRAENTVWVFNTSSLSLPAKIINVGLQPVSLATTSDSLLAFSANYAANSVSFISLESLTATDTVATSTGPIALSVSYNNATLFVACRSAGRLDEIDISAKSRTANYAVGPNPSDVAALKR